MNFWYFVLVPAFLAGIMSWPMMGVFNSIVLWTCDHLDGVQVDWGYRVVLTVGVPFAWIFACYEILVLYFCN